MSHPDPRSRPAYDRSGHRRAGFGQVGNALPLILDAERRGEHWERTLARGANPANVARPLSRVTAGGARSLLHAFSAVLRVTMLRPASTLWRARRMRVRRSPLSQLRLPMR